MKFSSVSEKVLAGSDGTSIKIGHTLQKTVNMKWNCLPAKILIFL